MKRPSDFIENLESESPGRFSVEGREGRCYVTVYPPGSHGQPVSLGDLKSRLKLFGINEYDEERLREILNSASGSPADLCAWQHPEVSDALVMVNVSEDKMEVEVELSPPRHGGALLSSEDVYSALSAKGVLFGIDNSAVEKALAQAQSEWSRDESEAASTAYGEARGASSNFDFVPRRRSIFFVAARGRAAVTGQNGYIRHYFNPHPRAAPEAPDDERGVARVDFRNLNMIQSCAAEQPLAQLVEASAGGDGCNVLGEVLAAPEVHSARLLAGRNTRFTGNGSELVAEIAGQVRIASAAGITRIEVAQILHLDQVDYSVGHVDFPGTVMIKGGILDGFSVRAQGDIVIMKSVSNVRLKADGDVVLTGGIAGRRGASIQASGSIYARYVENASLNAHESIFIEEAAMHARLVAGENVIIHGGKGELIGGTTLAGLRLSAVRIGARNETETVIQAGLDPDVAVELRRLEEEYQAKIGTLEKALLHISQIEEAQKRGRNNEDEQSETLEKLNKIRDDHNRQLAAIDEQREILYEQIAPQPDSYVEALSGVYPGVEVGFGAGIKKYRVAPRPIYNYCRFALDGNSVVLRHSKL